MKYYFRCVKCGFTEKDGKKQMMLCPSCGSNLDVMYNYDRISLSKKKNLSMWTFGELLPVSADPSALRTVIGGTPLIESRNTEGLLFKDDTRNPSLSFKDRASAIAIMKCIELGKKGVTTASTGNAAASLAALSALAGLKCVIFVPENAPPAKLAQILIHGSRLVKIKGTYDEAFDIATAFSRKSGYYLRNTGINPFMTEGKKTVSFEMHVQTDIGKIDNVFVSVGDGCIIGAVYKGFWELKKIGAIKKIPRVIGVQASGASPIATAFKKGSDDIKPVISRTLADSISVGNPRDPHKALRAARDSGGYFLTVTDSEIAAAQGELALKEGIYAEPAAAAAYAGYKRSREKGRSIVLVTGNGLKDIAFTLSHNSFKSITLDPAGKGLDRMVRDLS